jgi:phosphoserine phosphatase
MKKSAAFFDLDETLIGVNSANLWVKYMWESGRLGALDLVRSMGWMLRYKLALIDMQNVV